MELASREREFRWEVEEEGQSKSVVLGTQCKVQVFHSSAHCQRDASLRSVPLATRISLAMQGWSSQDGKSNARDLVVKVMR